MRWGIASAVICLLLGSMAVGTSVRAEQAATATSEQIESLRLLMPTAPAVVTPEVVEVMRRAAQTQRLDAAWLVIRCLEYNLDPGQSNERRDLESMLPALGLLKEYYGDGVLPLLYYEALSSNRRTFRERAAAAVRAIASPTQLEQLARVFGLPQSSDAAAAEFLAALVDPRLQVKFANPRAEDLERLDRAIEAIRKRRKPQD